MQLTETFPCERNTQEEKAAIKEGRIPKDWAPAKVRQKDRDARWSIKYTKPVLSLSKGPRSGKAPIPRQQSRSIWPFRCLGIKTISASIGPMG
jgi:hypothetical protein